MKNDMSAFVNAASQGDLATINACIDETIHLDDKAKASTALFNAITGKHVDCVRALVKAGIPVSNKHYYAAGSVGGLPGSQLFDVLRGQQYTRSQSLNETSFDGGDLKDLYKQLKSGSVSEAARSEYLVFAISQANVPAIRILLENKTAVTPEHYYAAGKYFDPDNPATEQVCKRIFTILEALRDNKQLIPRFYTSEETNAYLAAVGNPLTLTTPIAAPTATYPSIRRYY